MKDYAEFTSRIHRITVRLCDALEQKKWTLALSLAMELGRGAADIAIICLERIEDDNA